MSPAMNAPATSRHIFNTSHIGRDTKHSYISFVNVLPEYFAGKYWCFYFSGDKVREPSRIDPHRESVSFFIVSPTTETRVQDVSPHLQKFVSILESEWYDPESDAVKNSSTAYLPFWKDILDIVYERGSFRHSLVDLEPSSEEVINLAMTRVAGVYSKIEEVSSIYVSRYLDDITFTVLLQSTAYSRRLMDRLLEIEYPLHKQNPSLTMEFLYLPGLYEDRADIIHPRAVLIYDRETSAILSGSSLSSTT